MKDTMLEPINERVSVVTDYDHKSGRKVPIRLRWRGRDHRISKLGYHWRARQGRIWVHTFAVSTGAMDFRLRHHPEDLTWVLEEVSDGHAA